MSNAAQQPPLADSLRPSSLQDIVGQAEILSPQAPLGRMIAAGRLQSLILWGPSGTGKTSLARLLAQVGKLHFEAVAAVASGVAELRKIFESARARREQGLATLLFVDEVHRFNRAQQDVLLPVLEDGTLILVGATTENPSFALNSALLSRCLVITLRRLDPAAMAELLRRAEAHYGRALPLTPDARDQLMAFADGDGRALLTLVESLAASWPTTELTVADLGQWLQRRAPVYDRAQDEHYNLISALHKSLRGSDPDAALYWFARMLAGGEDPNFIARRLLRCASEDIGLSDPQALMHTLAAWQTYERLGSPEGELALAQAVIYLATAPKSNATYVAHKAALRAARDYGSLRPPKHILNAPTQLMRDQDYGHAYIYDHDTAEGFSGQDYFPEECKQRSFYKPPQRGFEREIIKRLDYWQKLRSRK
jgi:putative ATPase